MPTSEAQRRMAFSEISRRKEGKKASAFSGMSTEALTKYAHEPLHKKKKKKKDNLTDY